MRTPPEPGAPVSPPESSSGGPIQPKPSKIRDFPPGARVRRRWEFNRIHRDGVRVRTPNFTVIGLRSLTQVRPRFGCAVSRKVGNAVVRNRLRRLMKEIFRLSAHELDLAEVVVVVRPSAARYVRPGFDALREELWPALQTAARRGAQQKKVRRGRARRRA